MNLKKRNHPLKNGFFVMIHYVFLLSGFGLEFGDGGVVFGLGIIFKNDFLRCVEADDHVFLIVAMLACR